MVLVRGVPDLSAPMAASIFPSGWKATKKPDHHPGAGSGSPSTKPVSGSTRATQPCSPATANVAPSALKARP